MEKDRAQNKRQKCCQSCHSCPTGFSLCLSSFITTKLPSTKEVALGLENILRPIVAEEVEKAFQCYLSTACPLRSSQINNHTKEEVPAGETPKFKLIFLNDIPSTIFSNKDIEAVNGDPLQVAIFGVSDFSNIIKMGPLSSAQIELVVVDGEFGSGQKKEEIPWNATDFNKSVLSERGGKGPLIIGNDLKLHMENGVADIMELRFNDNSSWLKSKKFRLGARIIDEKILAEFRRIEEAISQPFRVKDQRGEGNKKHHPPKGEDEVWRLEGIGKNGAYHRTLSSVGIKTVDDFLKAYDENPLNLKKLLVKVPIKIWKAMVDNALERYSFVDFNLNFQIQDLTGNEYSES